MKPKSVILAITTMSLLYVTNANATPQPMDTIRTGATQVLQLLRTQSPSPQRLEELQSLSGRYIDFAEMSTRALGPNWDQQTPQKQQEFIQTFSQFLFNRYISQIEEYKDVRIDYTGEQVSGDSATVDTVIHTSQGEDLPITYRMGYRDGEWKAFDFLMDGVSLVNNYRSQFKSVLARSSFDDLLATLQDRNQNLVSTK